MQDVVRNRDLKSDAQLRRDVEDKLAAEPSVDSTAIGIAVKDGIVTLSGHVTSYSQKLAAEKCVVRVSGVSAIASELDIKLPASGRVNDVDTARTAINALAWNSLVPRDRIKVEVGKGLGHDRGRCGLALPEYGCARCGLES